MILERKRNEIAEKFVDDEDFISLEDSLTSMVNNNDDNVSDEFINLLTEIEDIVIEKAYLEGFKDGIADQVEKNTKSNVLSWLKMSQVNEILDRMEKRPAATTANLRKVK